MTEKIIVVGRVCLVTMLGDKCVFVPPLLLSLIFLSRMTQSVPTTLNMSTLCSFTISLYKSS